MNTERLPEETVCPFSVHRALVKALARDAVREARAIDVTTCGGEVCLVGHVGSQAAKQILLAAAHSIPGVQSVQDLIQVHDDLKHKPTWRTP